MKTRMKIEKEIREPKVPRRVWRRIATATKLFIGGAVLAAGLMLVPGTARADSIEVMAGNNKTTVDIKAAAQLTEKVGLFARLRPSVDYTGTLDTFGLMDLYINLFGPIDFVVEGQLAGGQLTPRGGLQYFGKFGDLAVYNLITFGLGAGKDVEVQTILTYTPKLNDTLGLLMKAENITNFGKEGNTYTLQRLRLGLTADRFGVGGAVDLLELGNDPRIGDGTLGYNVGGFGEVTF